MPEIVEMSLATSRTSSEKSDAPPAPISPHAEEFGAILKQLADGADRLEAWRALVSAIRTSGDGCKVPAKLIGSTNLAHNAEVCLAKAEVLLRSGELSAGTAWLRAAPGLAVGRRQSLEMSCRAAALDPEFSTLIAAADELRDAREWSRAERTYYDALRLYPEHAGYILQYAHCLKERGKLTDAEIQYRTALAYAIHRRTASRYGVSALEILHHIRFVASQRGYQETQGTSRTTIPEDPGDCSLLLEHPTDRDIVFAYELLHDRIPFRDEVLTRLREHPTLEAVLSALITSPDLVYSERDGPHRDSVI